MDKQEQYARAAALFEQMKASGMDEAEARASYDAAVARIAAMPDIPKPVTGGAAIASGSSQTPQNAPGVSKVPPTGFEAVKGALATGLQGATFGFADEAVGLVSPESGEALRNSASDFTKAYPKTAFGLNLAGGVATSGGLGGVAKAGIPLASKAAALLSKSAIAQGALAGAGMSEGDLSQRGLEAVTGGALSGLVGGTVGQVGKFAGQYGTRMLEGAKQPTRAAQRALSALVKRTSNSKVGLDGVQQPGTTAAGATIADKLQVPGERMLRGLRTKGGLAGERIDNWANDRLDSYPERITAALYNGKTIENVVNTTDELIEQGRAASAPLYERFRALPPVADDQIEELLTRDVFKDAMSAVKGSIRNLPPAERAKILGGKVKVSDDEMMQLRTPAFLDEVKKAAGDVIYSRKTAPAGTGGQGPVSQGRERAALKEFTARLDEVFKEPDGTKVYREARNAWAGPADLRDALDDGANAARGGRENTPEQVAKTFAALTDSEKGMYIRGMLDDYRQQAERGLLKPAQVKAPTFKKKLQAVLGADADVALARIQDEVRSTQLANTVAKGSQTRDKDADLTDELNPLAGHMARAIALPRRGVADLVDNLMVRAATPFRESTRNELTSLLLSPSDDARVLRAIAGEAKAQDVGRTVSRNFKPTGAAALETAYGFFRSPRDEQGKRR